MDTWEELIRENRILSRKSIIWDAYAARFQGLSSSLHHHFPTGNSGAGASKLILAPGLTLCCRECLSKLHTSSLWCCRVVNPEHNPKWTRSGSFNSKHCRNSVNQPPDCILGRSEVTFGCEGFPAPLSISRGCPLLPEPHRCDGAR